MKSNVFSKRIPTLLGILILLMGLIAGIVLVSQRQGLFTKAGPTAAPKNVKVANRGNNGFSVSWTSDVPVTGFVKYSDDPTKLTLPAGDVRDQISGSVSQYTTHYVDIVSLSPDKTYYFIIGSGSVTYDDSGKPYQVRTAPAAAVPAEDVVSGKIVTSSDTGVSGAIVYVEINEAETLSTLTKNDGAWRLALSNARNKNGDFVAYDKQKETVTIFAQAGASGTATAITTTANANPVPDITLGQTHNFSTGEVAPVISGLSGGAGAGNGFASLPGLTQPPEATFSVKLLNPASEGENLNTQTPEFLGTGLVGTEIKLTLDISGQSGIATAAASENWAWFPSIKLSTGKHAIEVAFKDEKGVSQKFSRGFTILAAGAGGVPAFTATPSGEVTPTPTEGVPATDGGLPKTGILTPTYTLLIVGIGLFFLGIIWRKRLLESSENW